MALTDRTRPVVMQFTRMVNQWKLYERRGHQLAGESFTAGELQVIKVVAEFPGRNTTELAAELGVTKGAVSQAVTKLVARGTLERYRAADNDRDRLTRLTTRGSQVYRAHMKAGEAQLRAFDALLAGAEPGQVQFMLEFVARIESFLRERIEDEES